VLELEGMEQHAILLDSVSKRFSLCGARIGFLASRNHELMGAATRMAQARLSPPAIEQIGVEGCMSIDPVYFTHMRDEYQRRRDVLVEGLKKMPGVVVPPIGGAFYAMVRLPIDDCDRFCAWMLTDFRHNMQTVMTAPGTGFYATPGAGRDEVRIAYVLEEGELHKALECLEQALQVYPGRTEAVVSV